MNNPLFLFIFLRINHNKKEGNDKLTKNRNKKYEITYSFSNDKNLLKKFLITYENKKSM